VLIICLTTAFGSWSAPEDLERYIAGIADRDESAFAKLYQAASNSVYGFALSIMKNTHDAEDVMQDCFLSVYHGAADYRPDGKPMAWILTIARNLCLMKLRKAKRNADIPEEDWEPYLTSKEGLAAEDRIVLESCIGLLAEEEKEILLLHVLGGMKHREIAELMRMPLATVLSKYHRTLKKLRAQMN